MWCWNKAVVWWWSGREGGAYRKRLSASRGSMVGVADGEETQVSASKMGGFSVSDCWRKGGGAKEEWLVNEDVWGGGWEAMERQQVVVVLL